MSFEWSISPELYVAVAVNIAVIIAGYVKTQEKANNALKLATEAKESSSVVASAFNMYQVNIARDYVSRVVLKEFEDRLTLSAKENVDRLAREISELREIIISGRMKQ